jgi:hypothetical protein
MTVEAVAVRDGEARIAVPAPAAEPTPSQPPQA